MKFLNKEDLNWLISYCQIMLKKEKDEGVRNIIKTKIKDYKKSLTSLK